MLLTVTAPPSSVNFTGHHIIQYVMFLCEWRGHVFSVNRRRKVILTVLILYYSTEWQYLYTYTSRERADYFIRYMNQLENVKLKLILPEQEVVIYDKQNEWAWSR